MATTVSILPPERYAELEVQFTEMGGPLPQPETSYIVVAEEDGEIKAFWVMQAAVHIEPCWVKPEERDRTGFFYKQLMPAMLATLQADGTRSFFAFADRDEIANYLLRIGLQPLPYVSFAGLVPAPEKELASPPKV
jgi:hypothetical protein